MTSTDTFFRQAALQPGFPGHLPYGQAVLQKSDLRLHTRPEYLSRTSHLQRHVLGSFPVSHLLQRVHLCSGIFQPHIIHTGRSRLCSFFLSPHTYKCTGLHLLLHPVQALLCEYQCHVFQNQFQILRNLLIHIRKNSRKCLKNRHLTAKFCVNRCEFHTDNSATDNCQALRHTLHTEQFITGQGLPEDPYLESAGSTA